MPETAPLPIAIVLSRFQPGGTERQMIELIRRLDPGRWRVHVACFDRSGSWADRVAELASIAVFPVRSFRRIDMFRHLRSFTRWCREKRIAVVHASELSSNIFALPAAAAARVPVRIGNRREINPDKRAYEIALQRMAYACAHKVVANSQAAADRLRLERVPAHKIAVIANGLDSAQFEPRLPRPKLRRVVVVANLRQEKGHDVLIDAAPAVLRRFPDASFEIVGEGPRLRDLLMRAEERGVLHAFTFAGHREDVPALLENADLFVLPSRSEAFPNAVLEAMAAGLPVVASAVGGIRELVDDETGRLVPPDDAGALATAICSLMADPARASSLGMLACARAQSRYSFERMVAAFETLYLGELARCGRLSGACPRLATS